MNPARYEYSCECGKTFKLNHDNLGGEMICPYCDCRFTIPYDLQPIEGISNASAAASRAASNGKPEETVRLKSLATGAAMIAGAILIIGLLVMSLYSGKIFRGTIYFIVIALALLVFGFGYLLRAIFGKRMEWD